MQLYVIFLLVIAFLVALFAMQNSNIITLVLLSWKFDTSLTVVIVGCVALGSILVGLLGGIAQFRLNLKLRGVRRTGVKLEEQVKRLEQERDDLKETILGLEQELIIAYANSKEESNATAVENGRINIKDADEDEPIDEYAQEENGYRP
jgi:putative membrane protein